MFSDIEQYKRIEAVLGPWGRMIASSKSAYSVSHPDHLIVFNAAVCTAEKKIWWGDIDLSRDEERLIKLAESIAQPVYLLSESDGWFKDEGGPPLEYAIYSCTEDGGSLIGHYLRGYCLHSGRLKKRHDA